MSDGKMRELERRYRETGTPEDGDAWVRAVVRHNGTDQIALAKHAIRLEWALREAAAASQPHSPRQSFGREMFARLTDPVSPETVIEYLCSGVVPPAPGAGSYDGPGDDPPAALMPDPWEVANIDENLYRDVLAALDLSPNARLQWVAIVRAYHDGQLQGLAGGGDGRRAIAEWVTAQNGGVGYGVCDVAHCQLAAIRERFDDRVRCAYHYNPMIHCADPACEVTTTASHRVRRSSGWRATPGAVHMETCPRHSQYTGDPRLIPPGAELFGLTPPDPDPDMGI